MISCSPSGSRRLLIRAFELLCLLPTACDRDVPGPEEAPRPLPMPPSSHADVTTTMASLATGEVSALRRGYGPVDMRFGACTSRKEDGLLVGQNCEQGTVIYGPYISVPAESEIEVTFEIKATVAVEVYGDLVSQMGQRFIAAINPQTLLAGEERKFGYRVRVLTNETAVESRIGLRAPGPIGFQIKNYTLTVR
jgi:hypothetical protein